MGLDIVVLKGARLIDPPPSDEAADRAGYYHAYVNSDFVDRADGLQDGYYDADEQERFRAGSYGYYNTWRRWLAQTMFGVAPEVIWEHADTFKGAAFVELIHFADNEGVIGPVTARKLAADFEQFDERAREAQDDNGFYARYCEFREAFTMAAEDGLVDFG